MCLFLAICASMQPVVKVDNQNLFSSSQPNLKLLVDKGLEYAGEFKDTKKMSGWSFDQEYYLFNKDEKILTFVIIKRIPMSSSYTWLPIKIKQGENGVITDNGTLKLAGKHWRTFLQVTKINPKETEFFYSKKIDVDQMYLTKNYACNINDKAQVYVIYAESLKGYEKEIEQYKKLKTFSNEQMELISAFMDRADKAITFLK